MFISWKLISLTTFPGVILHEISHRFFCDIFDVPVLDIKYFNPGCELAGYVIRQKTNNYRHNFLISIGPLIINSLICMLLTFTVNFRYFNGTEYIANNTHFYNFIENFLYWIGSSAGIHSIPSEKDISIFMEDDELGKNNFLLSILVHLIMLCNVNYLNIFLRYGYMYCISLILPMLVYYFIF